MSNERRTFKPLPGGGGSGGGSSDNCCCTSVKLGDIEHPHLPDGYDDSASRWSIGSSCGDVDVWAKLPTSDGKGYVVFNGLGGALIYEDTNHTFVYDVSAAVSVIKNDGTDVTLMATATATITMDWSDSDEAFVEFDFDASGIPS